MGRHVQKYGCTNLYLQNSVSLHVSTGTVFSIDWHIEKVLTCAIQAALAAALVSETSMQHSLLHTLFVLFSWWLRGKSSILLKVCAVENTRKGKF